MTDLDFLDVSDQEFASENGFFHHIDDTDALSDVGGNVNLIGAVNNYNSRQGFVSSLTSTFEIIWRKEDLFLLAAQSGGRTIPYYVYYDSDFPVFLTTANLTDEMPDTIEKYIHSNPNVGRFWLSMQQVERLRQTLVREYDDLIIPFFTGHRSEYTDIPSEKRGDISRTISYWAEDGRETYKEMRAKYGILPTNLRVEVPGKFKFGIKKEGIFSHQNGSIIDAWELYQSEKDRKQRLKNVINTGGFDESGSESQVFENHNISSSKPWAVEIDPIREEALNNFHNRIEEPRWEFGLSDFERRREPSFRAELVDDVRYCRTQLDGHRKQVRVYPLDGNDIDPQFRVFNFIQDHFDSNCSPAPI